MTIDEAISIMNAIVHMLEPQYDTDRIEEAVEMAIKALKQQVTDAVDRVTIKEYLDSFGKDTNVTTTDAVDRQEAINAAIEGADKWDGGYNNEREKCIREEIAKLPPVSPQQKWILCKDRMSDYNQLVLTFDGKYFCVEQRIPYIIDEDGKHIESEWWVDANRSELRDGAAVAWMPLPEKPYMQEVQE